MEEASSSTLVKTLLPPLLVATFPTDVPPTDDLPTAIVPIDVLPADVLPTATLPVATILAAKGKHERPPRKSRPAGLVIGTPPQKIPKPSETSHEDPEAPMEQENVEEEEYIFRKVANITLVDLANNVEELEENQDFLQHEQEDM